MMRLRVYVVLLGLAALLLVLTPGFRTAETVPNRLSDEAFWKLIETSSEPGGSFQSENFLSNETGFQAVIPTLKETVKPGGVYMGVGPEQNFTYIAAVQPKVAFIIDIRHQNMLEHLMYKALFEASGNRADFLSKLFARKRPAGLTDKSSIDQMFDAYLAVEPDSELFQRNSREIKDLLLHKHKLGLTEEDQSDLEHVYTVFRDFGPEMNYNSGSPRGSFGFGRGRGMPSYADLMTATDQQGQERSYLATEENYRFIRELESKNLVVPLTGDFGGPKAIRAVGKYVRDHNAAVSAFYLSNVEQYLFQGNGNQNGGWKSFYDSVSTLPVDASSTFIRSIGGRGFFGYGGRAAGMRAPNVLSSIQETLAAVKAGRVQTYYDILTMSK